MEDILKQFESNIESLIESGDLNKKNLLFILNNYLHHFNVSKTNLKQDYPFTKRGKPDLRYYPKNIREVLRQYQSWWNKDKELTKTLIEDIFTEFTDEGVKLYIEKYPRLRYLAKLYAPFENLQGKEISYEGQEKIIYRIQNQAYRFVK